jgi:hypothetical protein
MLKNIESFFEYHL